MVKVNLDNSGAQEVEKILGALSPVALEILKAIVGYAAVLYAAWKFREMEDAETKWFRDASGENIKFGVAMDA